MNDFIAGLISGSSILVYYSVWGYMVYRYPAKTVAGMMSSARKVWLANIVRAKKEIDAVQSLRNWILAATVLCTADVAITIGIPNFCLAVKQLMPIENVQEKVVLMVITFLCAFFCFAQSIRYFNHCVIALNCSVDESYWNSIQGIEIMREKPVTIHQASAFLNTACACFTTGLRFFYLGFPILMSIFGPWYVIASTYLLLLFLWRSDQYVSVSTTTNPEFIELARINL
jgi:uncharacterized membrane protein